MAQSQSATQVNAQAESSAMGASKNGKASAARRREFIKNEDGSYNCAEKGCHMPLFNRAIFRVHMKAFHNREVPFHEEDEGGPRLHGCPFEGCEEVFRESFQVSRHKWTHIVREDLPLCPGKLDDGHPCTFRFTGRNDIVVRHWTASHADQERPEKFEWPTFEAVLADAKGHKGTASRDKRMAESKGVPKQTADARPAKRRRLDYEHNGIGFVSNEPASMTPNTSFDGPIDLTGSPSFGDLIDLTGSPSFNGSIDLTGTPDTEDPYSEDPMDLTGTPDTSNPYSDDPIDLTGTPDTSNLYSNDPIDLTSTPDIHLVDSLPNTHTNPDMHFYPPTIAPHQAHYVPMAPMPVGQTGQTFAPNEYAYYFVDQPQSADQRYQSYYQGQDFGVVHQEQNRTTHNVQDFGFGYHDNASDMSSIYSRP